MVKVNRVAGIVTLCRTYSDVPTLGATARIGHFCHATAARLFRFVSQNKARRRFLVCLQPSPVLTGAYVTVLRMASNGVLSSISAEHIAAENDVRLESSAGGLRPSRAAARAPRRRHRGADGAGDRFPCGGAVVGRRHGRHSLRPLSRAGRAAQHLREARRLRRRLQARALDAGHLAAYPVGPSRARPRICARSRKRAGSSSSR